METARRNGALKRSGYLLPAFWKNEKQKKQPQEAAVKNNRICLLFLREETGRGRLARPGILRLERLGNISPDGGEQRASLQSLHTHDSVLFGQNQDILSQLSIRPIGLPVRIDPKLIAISVHRPGGRKVGEMVAGGLTDIGRGQDAPPAEFSLMKQELAEIAHLVDGEEKAVGGIDMPLGAERPIRVMDADRGEKPLPQIFQQIAAGPLFDEATHHIGVEIAV